MGMGGGVSGMYGGSFGGGGWVGGGKPPRAPSTQTPARMSRRIDGEYGSPMLSATTSPGSAPVDLPGGISHVDLGAAGLKQKLFSPSQDPAPLAPLALPAPAAPSVGLMGAIGDRHGSYGSAAAGGGAGRGSVELRANAASHDMRDYQSSPSMPVPGAPQHPSSTAFIDHLRQQQQGAPIAIFSTPTSPGILGGGGLFPGSSPGGGGWGGGGLQPGSSPGGMGVIHGSSPGGLDGGFAGMFGGCSPSSPSHATALLMQVEVLIYFFLLFFPSCTINDSFVDLVFTWKRV